MIDTVYVWCVPRSTCVSIWTSSRTRATSKFNLNNYTYTQKRKMSKKAKSATSNCTYQFVIRSCWIFFCPFHSAVWILFCGGWVVIFSNSYKIESKELQRRTEFLINLMSFFVCAYAALTVLVPLPVRCPYATVQQVRINHKRSIA